MRNPTDLNFKEAPKELKSVLKAPKVPLSFLQKLVKAFNKEWEKINSVEPGDKLPVKPEVKGIKFREQLEEVFEVPARKPAKPVRVAPIVFNRLTTRSNDARYPARIRKKPERLGF